MNWLRKVGQAALSRRRAVEWGIALGWVVGLAIMVDPWGPNDFSAVFWPVGRSAEPYRGSGIFAYPVWNVIALRVLAFFQPRVGLVCIYVVNVLAALALAPYWRTPSWLVLLSPLFLQGMVYGQPFEAFALAGLTLVVIGRHGLGLCLLAFKPQIGLAPALFVLFRKPKAAVLPALMALTVTGVDYLRTGRLWLFPWWEMAHRQLVVSSNLALWTELGVFSLLWVPFGLWLLRMVRGDVRKELWIVTAVGMLCMPYWTVISLWPLVAMVGCWCLEEP